MAQQIGIQQWTDPQTGQSPMREVSQDEFFARLDAEQRDVHPSIMPGRWPYTSLWKFQREPFAPAFGKSVDHADGETSYFLASPPDTAVSP